MPAATKRALPRRIGHSVVFGIAWSAAVVGTGAAHAQEPAATVPSITAAERLALEQIDQLIASDQADEAVRLIVRTMDEAEGRMVAVPRGAEMENDFVRFVPLRLFLQDRLLRWGESAPEVLQTYRRQADAVAKLGLESAARTRDLLDAQRLVERTLASGLGDEALLLAADLAIERGWMWRAIGYLRRIDPRWQATEAGPVAGEVRAVGWEMVLPRLSADQIDPLASAIDARIDEGAGWPIGCYHGSDLDQAAVGLRLVIAYRACGEEETAIRLAEMVRTWYPGATVTFLGDDQSIESALEQVLLGLRSPGTATSREASDQWPTLGHDAARVHRTGPLGDLSMLPLWTASLPNPSREDIRVPVEPPIGSTSSNFERPFPIIHHGLVMAQANRQLLAFRLADGTPWPVRDGSVPLYQDAERDSLLTVAGVMRVDVEPRSTLSAERGRVVGRFGPEPSGWLAVVRPPRAASRVTLVDLEREGQIVDGYPLAAQSLGADGVMEFEGAPLIVGSRMYAGVTERDDATLNSSVVCIDLISGQVLFQTDTIAAARHLSAEPANRLAQSLVSYREGIVYYHGDSGAVAAIDAWDGTVRWVMRYPRAELSASGYLPRRRAARTASSPVALLGPLALVAASDLDRLLAVDALDGRLLWATGPGVVDDVDQILGEIEGHVIAGGDSLYWLRRESGQIATRWPAGTTRQPHGALPDPRRAGRGLIAGRRIYWPTNEALWVFDARLSRIGETPLAHPLRRIDLRVLGLTGGDLIAADGVLLMSTPRMLAAFAAPVAYNEDSRENNKSDL